jgi:hypothetical protein
VPAGVDLGYRVIEEYMRQGQDFARSMWSPSGTLDPATMDPRRLTERMFQYASDLAATWLEFVQATMAGAPASGSGAPAPRPPTMGGFDIHRPAPEGPPAPPGESKDLLVSVDVSATQRVEVSVDLRPAAATTLAVHDLRAAEAGAPRIAGVTVERQADERWLVRVVVPDGQPAGTYSGLIVDRETNLPKGTLAVRVYE